ncbi:hypothetical protein RFI_10922 [Reticulomyxa filosa]|uniref:Uncharacterized protein n=1 Tax=Reticulomyxa filosa TaxID=46433 RepID=X6NIR2_RETFI|nr:hypothetical protein RFI_10922 [Reticulomyxa filosa]|eukprot:ETO26215.1 hypothetical protein RFI_10922 [Reticulomyxa filosa]
MQMVLRVNKERERDTDSGVESVFDDIATGSGIRKEAAADIYCDFGVSVVPTECPSVQDTPTLEPYLNPSDVRTVVHANPFFYNDSINSSANTNTNTNTNTDANTDTVVTYTKMCNNYLSTFDVTLKNCMLEENNDEQTLKSLLCEIISNGYLCDVVDSKVTLEPEKIKAIKKELRYSSKNSHKLKLNENVLVFLKQVKYVFRCNAHKRMGFPLSLSHICALLLYCTKSCSVQFSKKQSQMLQQKVVRNAKSKRESFEKWRWFDCCLHQAIHILSAREQRQKCAVHLFCGLRNVKFRNIEHEFMLGYFARYVYTYYDENVARKIRGKSGSVLKFHPSMRRALGIQSCDVSWLLASSHQGNKEVEPVVKMERDTENERVVINQGVVFARSLYVTENANANANASDTTLLKRAWNAQIESQDEKTQTILLTSSEYDRFLTQTLKISNLWNDTIDANVIYVALCLSNGDVEQATQLLGRFLFWKTVDDNKNLFAQCSNQFTHFCWNPHVNLFLLFVEDTCVLPNSPVALDAVQRATLFSLAGLPYVSK